MVELNVVLGALVTLVLSIAGMNIYRWRTDVLTGPYISNTGRQPTVPAKRADRTSRATAEKRRTTHPFLRGWDSDSLAPNPRRKATGHSSNWATDPGQPDAGLQSTVLSMKEFNAKKAADLLTAKSGLTQSSKSAESPDHDAYKMRSIS
jgi:hypothetical protein